MKRTPKGTPHEVFKNSQRNSLFLAAKWARLLEQKKSLPSANAEEKNASQKRGDLFALAMTNATIKHCHWEKRGDKPEGGRLPTTCIFIVFARPINDSADFPFGKRTAPSAH
ncbi:hypothetical protein M514_02188 [Trichuris suis]|uniref:Uncharacterized protein n=1 Tax=Trichuris suis TaxID=68888 RepID=A0A085MI85_9BILA|nr:hypothetical protein M513_02188 [Trichuris suis]KFD66175.1 hypothetical protein M514_02188 [Trichuris suis]